MGNLEYALEQAREVLQFAAEAAAAAKAANLRSCEHDLHRAALVAARQIDLAAASLDDAAAEALRRAQRVEAIGPLPMD